MHESQRTTSTTKNPDIRTRNKNLSQALSKAPFFKPSNFKRTSKKYSRFEFTITSKIHTINQTITVAGQSDNDDNNFNTVAGQTDYNVYTIQKWPGNPIKNQEKNEKEI